MGRYTEKTTITEVERTQLAGLLVIGHDLIQQEKRVVESVARILGEDPDNGHASDAVWSGYSVDDLLANSEITVQPPEATHRDRHEQLHRAYDELLADFLAQHRDKRPSNTTAAELAEWSHQQTIAPTPGEES